MTEARIFHVEITMTKVIEAKITSAMMSDDEDIEEVAQEVALMNFYSGEHEIESDYQVETVWEVTAKEPA